MRFAASLLVLGLVATGCTADDAADPGAVSTGSTIEPSEPVTPTVPTEEPSEGIGSEPRGPVAPEDFRLRTAVETVDHLAGTIGPRHATSPAYRRAAAWVGSRFRAFDYEVRRQPVAVPGGNSWGVPVAPGTSFNVIASRRGFDPRRPHLVVGAHLDTVPQAPGAEDNASGVGVLLAVAEAMFARRARLPVVLVAFGAEEPRGSTDADHHYGSRAYVASLGPAERRAVRGMLSLDRVGVGGVLPVGSAGDARAQEQALRAGRRAGVRVAAEENLSSDHWSFVREGMPGVRIGSTPYAEYHSAADLPRVVQPAQLERTGRLVLAWLARP